MTSSFGRIANLIPRLQFQVVQIVWTWWFRFFLRRDMGLWPFTQATWYNRAMEAPIITTYVPGFVPPVALDPHLITVGAVESPETNLPLTPGPTLVWLDTHENVIMVMTSTSQLLHTPHFLMSHQAFVDMPQHNFMLRLILHPEVKSEIKNLTWPENAYTPDWFEDVPSQIMKHKSVKLVVCMCGHNIIHEVSQQHLPIICLPYFADTFAYGQGIEENGAGLTYRMDEITPPKLEELIAKIFKNYEQFSRAAARIARFAISLGGASKAAHLIEMFAVDGWDYMIPDNHHYSFYQYYEIDIWMCRLTLCFVCFLIAWSARSLLPKVAEFLGVWR